VEPVPVPAKVKTPGVLPLKTPPVSVTLPEPASDPLIVAAAILLSTMLLFAPNVIAFVLPATPSV